jgi:hypothetical protein
MEPRRQGIDSLEREAAIFARYLVGREIGSELASRYVQADQMLQPKPQRPLDVSVVEFAVARPWSLAPLDAACALLNPESPLREKLLRMAAILEASPDGARDFLPSSSGRIATLFALARVAASATVQLIVGAALFKALEVRSRWRERKP